MTPESAKQVRELVEKNGPPLSPMLIFTLLDALEEAWAERDRCERNWHWWQKQAQSRQESQEGAQKKILRQRARISELEDKLARADEAMTALARVRALCDRHDPGIWDEKPTLTVAEIRAIIEGDGEGGQ